MRRDDARFCVNSPICPRLGRCQPCDYSASPKSSVLRTATVSTRCSSSTSAPWHRVHKSFVASGSICDAEVVTRHQHGVGGVDDLRQVVEGFGAFDLGHQRRRRAGAAQQRARLVHVRRGARCVGDFGRQAGLGWRGCDGLRSLGARDALRGDQRPGGRSGRWRSTPTTAGSWGPTTWCPRQVPTGTACALATGAAASGPGLGCICSSGPVGSRCREPVGSHCSAEPG